MKDKREITDKNRIMIATDMGRQSPMTLRVMTELTIGERSDFITYALKTD